jgi:hypothetical protein
MLAKPKAPASRIGSLNEKPLHAALKAWYARSRDRLEVSVDGFVVDIVQRRLLVEIQTRSFASIKRKLFSLTANHRVRLVHPIAQEKWIVKMSESGEEIARRKSPKRGSMDHVFNELVSFPKLLAHPNFSLMVLLIREEEVRRYDASRAWRRHGWVTHERRLLEVVDQRLFESPQDMSALLPPELPTAFTTSDLANATGGNRRLAQKMAYCLREMGMIAQVGTRTRAILYERSAEGRRTVA